MAEPADGTSERTRHEALASDDSRPGAEQESFRPDPLEAAGFERINASDAVDAETVDEDETAFAQAEAERAAAHASQCEARAVEAQQRADAAHDAAVSALKAVGDTAAEIAAAAHEADAKDVTTRNEIEVLRVDLDSANTAKHRRSVKGKIRRRESKLADLGVAARNGAEAAEAAAVAFYCAEHPGRRRSDIAAARIEVAGRRLTRQELQSAVVACVDAGVIEDRGGGKQGGLWHAEVATANMSAEESAREAQVLRAEADTAAGVAAAAAASAAGRTDPEKLVAWIRRSHGIGMRRRQHGWNGPCWLCAALGRPEVERGTLTLPDDAVPTCSVCDEDPDAAVRMKRAHGGASKHGDGGDGRPRSELGVAERDAVGLTTILETERTLVALDVRAERPVWAPAPAGWRHGVRPEQESPIRRGRVDNPFLEHLGKGLSTSEQEGLGYLGGWPPDAVLSADVAWRTFTLADQTMLRSQVKQKWRTPDQSRITPWQMPQNLWDEFVLAVAAERQFDPLIVWRDACRLQASRFIVPPVDPAVAMADFWCREWTPAEQRRAVEWYWRNIFSTLLTRIEEPASMQKDVGVSLSKPNFAKTTTLRMLAPLGYYRKVSLSVGSDAGERDFIEKVRQAAILNCDELAGLTRDPVLVNKAKEILTAETDSYSPKWVRHNVEVPRRCVVAGTANFKKFMPWDEGLRDRITLVRFPVQPREPVEGTLTPEVIDGLWASAVWHHDRRDEPEGLLWGRSTRGLAPDADTKRLSDRLLRMVLLESDLDDYEADVK